MYGFSVREAFFNGSGILLGRAPIWTRSPLSQYAPVGVQVFPTANRHVRMHFMNFRSLLDIRRRTIFFFI